MRYTEIRARNVHGESAYIIKQSWNNGRLRLALVATIVVRFVL